MSWACRTVRPNWRLCGNIWHAEQRKWIYITFNNSEIESLLLLKYLFVILYLQVAVFHFLLFHNDEPAGLRLSRFIFVICILLINCFLNNSLI